MITDNQQPPALLERLRGYNPPDRTVESDRQIATDIQAAANEIERLRAEIERWRDSNNRLRAEMEHQAKRANEAEAHILELRDHHE